MEMDLEHFKILFALETLYGTCTVSTDTLEQSQKKIIYNSFLVLLYVADYSKTFYTLIANSNIKIIIVFGCTSLAAFFVILANLSSVFDYKTKISAALTLVRVKNYLNDEISTADGKREFKTEAWFVVFLNLIFVAVRIFRILFMHYVPLPFNNGILKVLFHGSMTLEAMVIALYLSNVVRIQYQITKSIGERLVHSQHLANAQQVNCQRSIGSGNLEVANNETGRQFKFLISLQSYLNTTEFNLRKHFFLFVLLLKYILELSVPCGYSYLYKVDKLAKWYILPQVVAFLYIIIVSERMQKAKKEARMKLSSNLYGTRLRVLRRPIKHQLLANIHSSKPFSCCIFDVDYCLVLDMLENMVLVVLTLT